MNRNFLALLTVALATAAIRLVASGTNNPAPLTPVPSRPASANPAPAAPTPIAATHADANPTSVAPDASPEPVSADGKLDFQSFHLITDRNIFDMSRTGIRIRDKAVHQVKVEEFTLNGIMSYEKGQYAFFAVSWLGSEQTHKIADMIADYKITAIGSDYVELRATNESKVVKMPAGTTIRREDNGPWSAPTVRSETVFADSGSSSSEEDNRGSREQRGSRSDRGSRADRSSRSSRGQRGAGTDTGTPSTSDQPADTSSGGSAEDVIKRLMEKRAREVKDDQ
jgi:hypothetical protein